MDPSRDRRSRQAAFVLSAGALAGVLIWAKLRLVTDIPRSAYAEPERAQSGGDGAREDGAGPRPAHDGRADGEQAHDGPVESENGG